MIPPMNPMHYRPVYPLPPETEMVRVTAPRRKLVADLARIRTFFEPNMQDEVSNLIRQWHTNFTTGLKERRTVQNAGESDNARFNRILNTHLKQMWELLRDPLTNTPLDREAMLGSDDEIYGYKSLCLAISRLSPEYAHSSPLHLNPAIPFTARPHLLARQMVGFLAEWNALEPSQPLEDEFNAFFQTHPMPVIPETPVAAVANPAPAQPAQVWPQQNRPRMMTLADLRVRDAVNPPAHQPAMHGPRPRIMTLADLRAEDAAAGAVPHAPAHRGRSNIMTLADLRAQDAMEAQEAEAPPIPSEAPSPQSGFSEDDLANLLGIIDEQEQFEAQEAQHQAEENAALAQNLNAMVGAVIEGIQQEFAPLQERQAAFRAEITQAIQEYQAQNNADIGELQNEIDAIQQEIAAVTAQIQQLPTHIHTLQHEILEAKKEDLELERDIRQLSQAVKEKKKSSLDALGAFVMVGICVGLTALTGSVSAYWLPNSMTAVFPTSSGTGLQFSTTIFV